VQDAAPDEGRKYDLVVIGAGSAGVWAAPFAVRVGARVAVVEKERIDGECTSYSCVPSKPMMKAAGVAWQLRSASTFETREVLARAGVDVIDGAARFEDPQTLSVGSQARLKACHFLVCTGAQPITPNIQGLDRTPYWNYLTAWKQDRLPQRLRVLGSGPLGTQSQAFARFGSHVTVFERGDRPPRVADAELRQQVQSLTLTTGGLDGRDPAAQPATAGAPRRACAYWHAVSTGTRIWRLPAGPGRGGITVVALHSAPLRS
jgi:pyruvate/2-oxoglutarate dehydrogenase complex dihydrolipoamide dehydrogenase (E3) component